MTISRSTIIYSLIWKFLERCSVQVVAFVISIVLARLLMPSEFGIVAIIMVFINLANVIIEGGLNTALVQKKNADNVDFSTIFYTSIIACIFFYVILYFTSPLIADFYNEQKITSLLRVLGINIFFYAVNSIQRAYISRYMLFKKLFLISFVAVIVSGAIGLYMAYNGFGVWSLVGQNMSCQIATTIVMWFLVKWRPIFTFSFHRFKSLFNYGWKILVTNIITTLFTNIRGLIIGKVYNSSSLAYFDRGQQMPNLLMGNIISAIQAILFPVFSSEQDDKERVKSMVRRSIKTSSLIICPCLAGLYVITKPLVIVLLTDKWIEAIPFMHIFCIAQILMPIQITNIQAIMSMGYSNITLKLELIKKGIEIIILIVSVALGIKAIAWGMVAYNFICIFVNLFPNKKILKYGPIEQLRDVLPQFAVSIAMAIIIYPICLLGLSNLVLLLTQIFAGIIVFILLCLLFKIESYTYIANLIKSKINRL